MSFRYVVVGAGRQGVAIAYDLARAGEAGAIMLADVHEGVAARGAGRLRELLPDTACEFTSRACDVRQAPQLADTVNGADVVISAAPYAFSEILTDAAIAVGASFCDLGGNTDVVRRQLARDAAARQAGVSVVPDCGLAPGLGNLLAAHGVAALDEPVAAHVRCGGLPQTPIAPLGYKLVFNFDGLVNEYSGCGEFLRAGQLVAIPALTELEEIDLPRPLGRCEAAVTSGGTSTCAETFLGRLQAYDYKTIRYPGHFAIVRAMFELGCFDERRELPGGGVVRPREVTRALFESALAHPDVPDLVVLRVTVQGRQAGRAVARRYDLLDRQCPQTGFSAMERTTAFPAALVAHFQARQLVPAGAATGERCLPLEQYVSELAGHDIHVEVSEGAS